MRRTIVICSRHIALIMRMITPKAIILAHAAYNRCELARCSTHYYNNHAKGNNTHACGVQSLSARATPRSQWRVACRLGFVFFVSFAAFFLSRFVFLFCFVFICVVRLFFLSRSILFFCLVCCFCFLSFFLFCRDVARDSYPTIMKNKKIWKYSKF